MPSADAASVNWGPVFEIFTDADIDTTYPIVQALNSGETANNYDVTLGAQVVTFVPHQPFVGNNVGAGGTPEIASTGNAELDSVFDSHSWQDGNPVDPPAEFTLENLTPGATYQVQLIAAADGRTCCGNRAQIYQDTLDGSGNNTDRVFRSSDLTMSGELRANSVIGWFTADAETQSFWAASGGDDTVDPPIPGNDPGLSAVIVSQVPEPSSVAIMLVIGVSSLALRRRMVA
jgi:hypothetical protein